MDWKNVQLLFFNPAILGNPSFVVNGPDYRIKGIELQPVARVTEGLTVQGSNAANTLKQTNSPCLIVNHRGTRPSAAPASLTGARERALPLPNPFGDEGSHLAFRRPSSSTCACATTGRSATTRAFVRSARSTSSACQRPASSSRRPACTTRQLHWLATISRYTTSTRHQLARTTGRRRSTARTSPTRDASVFTSSAQFIKSRSATPAAGAGIKIGYKF